MYLTFICQGLFSAYLGGTYKQNGSKFVKFVGDNIDNYFRMSTDQTSVGVRWEAFKANIRGVMIANQSPGSN